MIKKEITELTDLDNVTKKFIPLLKNNPLIYLRGDLGAGKTTFVKSLLNNLGYQDIVSSPTFSLVNNYVINDLQIFHCDFYRLESENEIFNLAIEEFIGNTIVIIEWPDLFEKISDYKKIEINISLNGDKRFVEIKSSNACNLKLINKIYQDI
jgi:tRNA threonylcarbamoyladenosine biosynthesis protein TsaE